MIYAIRCGTSGPVKIGFADWKRGAQPKLHYAMSLICADPESFSALFEHLGYELKPLDNIRASHRMTGRLIARLDQHHRDARRAG